MPPGEARRQVAGALRRGRPLCPLRLAPLPLQARGEPDRRCCGGGPGPARAQRADRGCALRRGLRRRAAGAGQRSRGRRSRQVPGRRGLSALSLLHAGADALAFLSVCENCPNLVLEALNAGGPLVLADRPILTELAGDAALYVDPDRARRKWRQLWSACLTDPALRDDLRSRARARARAFSWDAAAADTLALLERVGGARRGARGVSASRVAVLLSVVLAGCRPGLRLRGAVGPGVAALRGGRPLRPVAAARTRRRQRGRCAAPRPRCSSRRWRCCCGPDCRPSLWAPASCAPWRREAPRCSRAPFPRAAGNRSRPGSWRARVRWAPSWRREAVPQGTTRRRGPQRRARALHPSRGHAGRDPHVADAASRVPDRRRRGARRHRRATGSCGASA